MRIPVCVLRNHKPSHPSACYREASANQHHASNSRYKCFGRGAQTVATLAKNFERPPRRTIRDRNLVTSTGMGSTCRKPLSSPTTPYRQKSSPGIYHLARSVVELLFPRDKHVFLDPQLLNFRVQRRSGNSEFRCRAFWAGNFASTFR